MESLPKTKDLKPLIASRLGELLGSGPVRWDMGWGQRKEKWEMGTSDSDPILKIIIMRPTVYFS